ncbi:betaTry family protein [Megaselia abdita]
MFRFVCLLAVIACASAGILPDFLQVPKLDGRIVGGQPTTIEAHPYQVSLFNNGGSHFCGGSLVSARTVVTAAHCTAGANANRLQVRLGSTSRSSGGVVVGVSSIRSNENYNSKTYANDIAVLILDRAVEFTDAIQPISLASVDPAPGSLAVVTGWGSLKEGGFTLPTTLQEVLVDIISRTSCQQSYGKSYEINSSMICAAAPGKDACQGDSGGPLVSVDKRELIGVVSWGIGCARSNYPGVYGAVPDLRSWVINNGVW